MIKVSIAIAAYNIEDYVSRCLESVVAQTLKDIEIIVVNDGSDDATKAILDSIDKKVYSSNSIDQLFEDSIPYKERFIIVN